MNDIHIDDEEGEEEEKEPDDEEVMEEVKLEVNFSRKLEIKQ